MRKVEKVMMTIGNFKMVSFSFIPCSAQSWTADNGNGTYTNPLFYDEFSDPDIIRVGDDYYLAGTTMHTVPGLVILHSKDLVNWENISYCFDRFDFDDDAFSLKNHKEIYGQGVWAPAIRYAKPSVTQTDSFMYSPTLMEKVCSVTLLRISAVRGSTTICRAVSMISQCSSTTMVRYMPSMVMAK